MTTDRKICSTYRGTVNHALTLLARARAVAVMMVPAAGAR